MALLGEDSCTGAFLDMACLKGAEAETGDLVFLHRCLYHIKRDIRRAAAKKCESTRKVRLQRPELVHVIIGWVGFSAWLPSDLEFDVFWTHLLRRMAADKKDTDFREPAMSKYLREHILDMSGSLIRAAWSSGFGCVPLGAHNIRSKLH